MLSAVVTYYLKLRNEIDRNNTVSFAFGMHSGKFPHLNSGNEGIGTAGIVILEMITVFLAIHFVISLYASN